MRLRMCVVTSLFLVFVGHASADSTTPQRTGSGVGTSASSSQSVGDQANVRAYQWNALTQQLALQSMKAEPSTQRESTECKAVLTALGYKSCDGTEKVSMPNGCRNAEGGVPDHFVGLPGAGNIFTHACNTHDLCYSTINAVRQQCDIALGDAMRAECRQIFDPSTPAWATKPPSEVYDLQTTCNLQAQAYESGFFATMNESDATTHGHGKASSHRAQTQPSSEKAFQAAQHAAICEDLKNKRMNACGF